MKQPNQKTLAALAVLLSDAQPGHLYNSLTRLLVDYLFYNKDGLPTDFEYLLSDIEKLLTFLAIAGEEDG